MGGLKVECLAWQKGCFLVGWLSTQERAPLKEAACLEAPGRKSLQEAVARSRGDWWPLHTHTRGQRNGKFPKEGRCRGLNVYSKFVYWNLVQNMIGLVEVALFLPFRLPCEETIPPLYRKQHSGCLSSRQQRPSLHQIPSLILGFQTVRNKLLLFINDPLRHFVIAPW